MVTQPRVCPFTDIPKVAKTITEVMCQSFPLIQFLYHLPKGQVCSVPYGKRETLSAYLYQVKTKGLILSVDDEAEKCIGVAVWTAPTNSTIFRRNWLEKINNWLTLGFFQVWLGLSLLYYGSKMDMKRKTAVDKVASQLKSEIIGDGKERDLWYCHFIVVRPEYQGKGIGKALMKYVTDMADREGAKCYLNTSLYEPNVAIYKKLGFELKRTGEVKVDDVDFEFYCMLREPMNIITTTA